MKHEISALMDSELFEDEADSLLSRMNKGAGARKDWEIYHLIGDVLRQPEHIHCDMSANVRKRLLDEPTILAPRGQMAKRSIRTIAISAAASVVAFSVVIWMSQQIGRESVTQMAMQQNAIRPVSVQIKPISNEYLMAHQEFSPSTDMNGGASYIRMVSFNPENK
ncbi:MAG: sigma-E factor negative regulatory protein [Gallionella sp.]